jgi:hypothetical protein
MALQSQPENVVSNIAPLSKIITIDVPFVVGETVLPVGAFVEGTYKAITDSKKGFRKNLSDETFIKRYAGIPETLRAQAEKELALEKMYEAGILQRPRTSGPYYGASLGGDYDDGISSLLLGYTTQATGNPNLEISKLKDEVGPLLPKSFGRGAQLFKAGRDAGTAIHEYLTEQRMLNQRGLRSD